MSDFEFYIDVEDSSGVQQGAGPITSASGWSYTARMDRAGTFSFSMPASDDMASEVQKKRTARAYALVGGEWTEVGAGIIDNIVKEPQADGTVQLSVSGGSEERELTYRSVGFLALESSGAGVTHSAALTSIGALAPSGWTFTADSSPGHNRIYGRFAGETVLQALVRLSEKTQSHFYRSGAKAITFASSFTDSGVTAIQAGGDLTDATCAIVSLSEQIDTYDLITRIYPYGAGQGQARLTLAATNQSAPTGYTLDAVNNYIENDSANSTYGQIEQYVEFKDVAPVSNTDTDLQSAANMLLAVALEELTRRSTELEQATYTLSLAQCGVLLRPMQTIAVDYYDPDAGMDIAADLNILESTIEVDVNGLRTTGLVVSNADRWPENDSDIVADSMTQGMVFQSHPQLNANSYTTGYTKNVDNDYNAGFRFRFGTEVVQLQQVLFEFQLLPFESTVKSVAGETITSGSGGNHTHTVTVAAHSHTVTVAAHSHTVTVAAHSHTVTVAAHTHTVTIAAHSHTVTIAAHSHTVTVAAHSHTVTVAAHTHTVPNHTHLTIIAEDSTPTDKNPVYLSTNGFLFHDGSQFSGGKGLVTDIGYGEVTSESGGGESPTSSQLAEATPSSSQLAQATPSSSQLAQTTPSSSQLAQTTPSSSQEAEATPVSTLLAEATPVSTVLEQKTPSSSASGTHTHTLTPNISPSYGVYREDAAATYELQHLQYQVNSGAWADLVGAATDAGSSWWALDASSDLMDASTFRPVQTSNLISVRAKTYSVEMAQAGAGPSANALMTDIATIFSVGDTFEVTGTADWNGIWTVFALPSADVANLTEPASGGPDQTGTAALRRTVTMDAQLSVRNIIQAIAYT